jgi:hypothetical protein
MGSVTKRVMQVLALAGVIFAGGPSAFAQGCALCYETASATGAHGQRMLDIGILVLLLPCLALFVGVFVLLIRRANAAAA